MLKLDTAVIIDCVTHSSLEPEIFDQQNHYKWYWDTAEYLKKIIEITSVDNLVYASYGSRNETTDTCTDIVFKDHVNFPNRLNKVIAYGTFEQEQYFNDKNILLAGLSFYTCVAQRELGFMHLLKNPAIKGVYSSPPLTGYYGVGENATPDSEALKHNQPVGVVRATDRDFEKDHRVDWQRIELTDIYRVFKCEPINTRG